jgi:hypothetical protein
MRVLGILNPNETFARAETGAVQERLFAVLNVEICSTGQSGTLLSEHREIVFANSRPVLGWETSARAIFRPRSAWPTWMLPAPICRI